MQPILRLCLLVVALRVISSTAENPGAAVSEIPTLAEAEKENTKTNEATTATIAAEAFVPETPPPKAQEIEMGPGVASVGNVEKVEENSDEVQVAGATETHEKKTVLKRDPEDLSGLNYVVEEVANKFEEGLPNLNEASVAVESLGKSAEALVIPEDAIEAEPALLEAKETAEKQQHQPQQPQQPLEVTEVKREQLQTSSLRSSNNEVVHNVNNVNSISNGGSRVSLQAREDNEDWYDTFGEYKFEVVSIPTRWLELNLCSYNATSGAATVGATSMIPLDVCHKSAYHKGKSMGDHDTADLDGHHISYKANITANGLLSIFYDYDCDENSTSFNSTLSQQLLFGHINTTYSCSWDPEEGNPMYSAKIYNQTTIPSPPSYNGRLETWYSDGSCGTMSGWNFVKSDACVRDESKMMFSTNNPSGNPFYVTATDGTAANGGEIISFPGSNHFCTGSNSTEDRKLGTTSICSEGYTVLKDDANYTVMGELGLGTHFKAAWLPALDETTQDAVDIALTGDVDALSALMDSKGVEFLMQDNYGVTAASISAVKGNLDAVKLLVTRGGVSIDATGNTGNSFLTWAAKYGKIDLVNYLIQQNAKLDVKNKDGKSALMLAYENGYRNIANALLAAGASAF